MNEPLEHLAEKLKQALEITDRLGLDVVGAWLSSAIEALPTAGNATFRDDEDSRG